MTLYIILLCLSTGSTLTLAVQAWFQRSSQGLATLFFFLLSVGIASFAYAMNLNAPTLEQKLFWNRVEYLGGAFIPALMLAVVPGLTGLAA